MKLSIILSYAYVLIPSTFCAKYRQKRPQRDTLTAEHMERTPLISRIGENEEHPSSSQLIKPSNVGTSSEVNLLQDVPFELIRHGQPGYNNRNGIVNRTAYRIFHSDKGLKASESLKLAEKQYLERKKFIRNKSRDKLKTQGIIRKDWRGKGYNGKEAVISRKVISLLGENNHIVRHDDARKAAEELYKEKNRIRMRNYREKKHRSAKGKDDHTPNKRSSAR